MTNYNATSFQGKKISLGVVRFQLPEPKPGMHALKLKEWDALNNSPEVILDFAVAKDESPELSHVLNYPNPFTTKTQFWFEHNKPGQDLQVRLQIFTLTRRVIKIIQKTINTAGTRSIKSGMGWKRMNMAIKQAEESIFTNSLSLCPAN